MPAVASIPPLPTAEDRIQWNERARRQLLRVMGVENADTLHRDALPEALVQANQLATEVQDLGAAIILASPDPFTARAVQAVIEHETPDEALSTLSYRFNRMVEPWEFALGIAPSGVELTMGGDAA